MAIDFIPALPAEAEALSELRRRVWETTYRGIYPDDMLDDFDYAFHNERNRILIESRAFAVYFLTEDGEKVGYLILRKGNPLHLQSLYLLKESRGKGIGTTAIAFVRQYCCDHGIAKFDLDCHPDNRGALAFYAKMGGVITARDEGHVRNEENGLRLEFEV